MQMAVKCHLYCIKHGELAIEHANDMCSNYDPLSY